ncbi:hypothetical protein BJX99DRAFT_222135 [Aspergillus californicus]
MSQPKCSLSLQFYLAWVNAWISSSQSELKDEKSLDEQIEIFRRESSSHFPDHRALLSVALSVRQSLRDGSITFGGRDAPSCDETNLASETYNPASSCSCRGLYPLPSAATVDTVLQQTRCTAIQRTLDARDAVLHRQNEWSTSTFYTSTKLSEAVEELILASSDIQPPPTTCQGLGSHVNNIPPVCAPDRRPDPTHDTHPQIHSQMYATAENLKLCADAKHYWVFATAPRNPSYDGLLRAIADSGNDILIGDYCEVVDDHTLQLLQRTGAAAVAFLKLCVHSGAFSGWAFDNMMALILHFRVLGYYRDHAREHMPPGIYGSRMTGHLVHRHIDLALFIAIAAASVTTAEVLSEEQTTLIHEACTLINDMVDLRSDTARKQRENVVLRGARGNLCQYLDDLISQLLNKATQAVRSSTTCALVVMVFCNWSVMASHHKMYEISQQVSEISSNPPCEYQCVTNRGGYLDLLDALTPFGTLGQDGPCVSNESGDGYGTQYLSTIKGRTSGLVGRHDTESFEPGNPSKDNGRSTLQVEGKCRRR